MNEDKMTSLGKGYWLAFLMGNRDKVITAYITCLNVNRVKYIMHINFIIMHDLIHEQFLEAGICAESIEAKMHDGKENVIDNEDNMVRLPKKYELIHPNYLLITDEFWSNLHCDYNNNIRGEKYMLRVSNNYATIKSNNNDYRFFILGFTSANR